MSAFIVSDDHISLLVTAAIEAPYFDASDITGRQGAPVASNEDTETTLGKALLRENTRSVMARYRGEDCGGNDALVNYRFRRVPRTLATPAQVLKACDCYDYQACETADYAESWAAHYVALIRKAMISRVIGYDDAQWCFVMPDDMPETISLADLARRKA